MRNRASLKKIDNPREYKLLKKHEDLKCPICPPNKGENAKRKAKHGKTKSKYKDKRK